MPVHVSFWTMRRKPFIIILAIAMALCLPSSRAGAQHLPLWALGQHDRDLETAQSEIAEGTSKGFLPVGIEVEPNGIFVLYSLNLGTPVREVLIYLFDDPETRDGEMNTLIQRDLVPMDISETDEGLYGLFISDGFGVSGWQIVNLPFNTATIEEVHTILSDRGLSPWGLTVRGQQASILALDEAEGRAPRNVVLLSHRFNLDSYFPAINEAVQQRNLYPWGLAIAENQLLIQYARNN
jgi:hypothetical protein